MISMKNVIKSIVSHSIWLAFRFLSCLSLYYLYHFLFYGIVSVFQVCRFYDLHFCNVCIVGFVESESTSP